MTDNQEIYITLISVTIVITLLGFFIVSFALLFNQRQAKFRQEKQFIQEEYQRELLKTQLETQNQTLQHIAGELHDHIGQLLTVAAMRLNNLEDELNKPDVQRSVQQTRDVISTVITNVRALAKTLDYDTVKRFGLLPSLTHELERIQRTGRIKTRLQTVGEPYALGEQAEIVLLRMAQESLNNALKHAKAYTLTVEVNFQSDQLQLTIADDGCGFEIAEITPRILGQAGSGLGNLQRRAGMLGGHCLVDSHLNVGTRVFIYVPRLTNR